MPLYDFVLGGTTGSAHPLLRLLDARLNSGYQVEVHLKLPPRLVGFPRPMLQIHLRNGQSQPEPIEEEWDDELNDRLVHLRIKADSVENEQARFALALRASFRAVEHRYGDGFFSTNLVAFLQAGDFATHPTVATVLAHAPTGQPTQGTASADCQAMIDHAIRTRGLELTRDLGYPTAVAVEILAGAVATDLDERFSVTNRRSLGVL